MTHVMTEVMKEQGFGLSWASFFFFFAVRKISFETGYWVILEIGEVFVDGDRDQGKAWVEWEVGC